MVREFVFLFVFFDAPSILLLKSTTVNNRENHTFNFQFSRTPLFFVIQDNDFSVKKHFYHSFLHTGLQPGDEDDASNFDRQIDLKPTTQQICSFFLADFSVH